ncbi:MAG: hypothetical protein A2469_02040 [Candidatus Magasanikbacteria bacterium RIFOXYC2_FULL_40_16]|uniref:Uncharacterized protein n=2 Tax=Candidatus Magasanikiibacteriota TaxID=1752731 RepID=A0A1F6NFU8_9BACT|nr:MAG: hypothetical protein A2224_02085 [Candidatus Magasanikbacteria bacterium RIFOXYA2_FULL_40_20]OGH82658.1 MAG: hypothetical protein A2373_02225 [Candidatus Magasanikbacteria bacterium RIFOXYB1_FULL_40_15]OGH89776.1 MAG: hypothetical protein A2469_02040 [Candidatus Magasanikbacteria bacterium RIFOXYC2_FULL_40_16]
MGEIKNSENRQDAILDEDIINRIIDEEEKKKDSPEDRPHAPTPEPPSPNDEPEDEGEKSSRTGGGSIKIDIYGEEEKDDSGSVDIYGGNTDY